MHGLGRLHGFAKRRIVGRHIAPANERQALALDHLRVDIADDLAPVGILRHEQHANSVFAAFRQREAELLGFLGKEFVRNLHKDAGTVAGARIGADCAAVFQVAQDGQRVLDDLVRGLALDVGDEADAAGVLVEPRIVEALHRRQAGVAAIGKGKPSRRGDTIVTRSGGSVLAVEPGRAHNLPRRSSAHPPRSAAPAGAAAGANRAVWGGLATRRRRQACDRSSGPAALRQRRVACYARRRRFSPSPPRNRNWDSNAVLTHHAKF